MIHEMYDMLSQAQRRLRTFRVWSAIALCGLAWGGVMWGMWSVGASMARPALSLWIGLGAGATLTALIAVWWAIRPTRDPNWIARQIERQHPELGASLLTALEQAPTARSRPEGYLQRAVIEHALEHGRRHNWAADVSLGSVWLVQLVSIAAMGVLSAACVLMVFREDATASAVDAGPPPAHPATHLDFDIEVEPGDTEVERGTALLVTARFGREIPDQVDLTWRADPAGSRAQPEESVTRRVMTQSLADPRFVGRIPSVRSDLVYRIEYGTDKSKQYRARVFEYPALDRIDAELVYPEYTQLAPKRIDQVRHLTAVEGTQLTLKFHLNKPVARALVRDRDGNETLLHPETSADAPLYTASLTLAESQRYKLHLVDEEGRKNKVVPELAINVTPNRPPTLKVTRPASDVRVSPLEELAVAAKLADDFGLVRYGVNYALGGNTPTEIVLFESVPGEATRKAELAHLIDFEALEVEPDQLASYYLWAEDIGPDGEPRRTVGDMYFAEVRHFEEIFREGQQPTAQQQREQQEQQEGGGGTAGQAEELAELQKQIIAATWKVLRREGHSSLSDEFETDVRLVADSQQQAATQLEQLQGELADAESVQFAADALQHMQQAVTELTAAADGGTSEPLTEALSAQQAAYQGLLKLRAREFQVAESNQQQSSPSGSSSAGGNRSQQQLQQLELSADENRYETQSRATDAQQQATAEQQEARETLNRLRELARRQEDLNERVREMQAELQAAETEEEQQRLERELKRLREQQQEILQDTDQLQSDLENSQTATPTEQSREQLEETRSRVQQASEALDQGELDRALTEGTRAERGLSDLRNDFRRRAADRFADEVRELRDAAEQLEQTQQQLSEQLARENQSQPRSLRDEGERESLSEGIANQRRAYDDLLERMQQTVEEAQEPEPLLARELYEAATEANDRHVDQALEVTEQLLEMGIPQEAGEPMRAADEGIEQLRDRLDEASESVLGDETESLRRAERELSELAEELQREIEQGAGSSGNESQTDRQQQPAGESGPLQLGTARGESSDQPGEGQQTAGASSDNLDNPDPQGPASESEPSASQSSAVLPEEEPQEGQQESGEQQASRSGRASAAESAEAPTGEPADEDAPAEERASPLGEGESQSGGGDFGGDEWGDFFRDFNVPSGPITGESFREWNQRMRDVEDLLDDPELRGEAARLRDRAEAARREFKRHAREPDWTKLQDSVAQPLTELRRRVAEEIRRKESPDALVPIDRDPVPVEYTERVRRYYQRLGEGE